MSRELKPTDYYRLPWSLTDNALSWLEPTKRCNLRCEGCYSRNDPNSDKTLDQIRGDLEVLAGQRRVDSISIAGGELSLSVERPDVRQENVTYHRRERPLGSFTRVLRLPTDVDADNVEAQLRDGVLTLRLPKAENVKARKITVATA